MLFPSNNAALHKACANSHLDVVQLLVKKGATFSLNENGNTPLHWAIQNKALEVVKFLLANCPGVNVLHTNSFGKSCVSEAFNADHSDILAAILSHPSAKGLEEQYAGKAGADGAEAAPMDASEPDDAPPLNPADDPKHPSDSKITQTITHEFAFDGTTTNPVHVREVVTDWTGAVFDTDSARDTTGKYTSRKCVKT